jgi:hypothetical protein
VPPPSNLPTLGEMFRRPEVTALVGGALLLVGLGTAIFPVAAAGVFITLAGLKLWHSRRRRVSRLTKRLHQTFVHAADHAQMFGGFVDAVDTQDVWPLVYAAFFEWAEDGSGGIAKLERGDHRPPDTAVVSWLLREAESRAGLAVDEGVELPSVGFAAALPLRRDNSSLVGFILLCGKDEPPAHVVPALEACLDALGPAFGEARPADVLRLRKENVTRLDPHRRREARTLEA